MKNTLLCLLLVLCLLVSSAGFAEPAPAEKTAVLYTATSEEAGGLTIRFYEETPHVPYLGISEYMAQVMHFTMTVEANEDGTLTLKNGLGGELLCDAATGTITARDWMKMITPEMPLEGAAHSLKDSNCAFVRITDITYEGEPTPIIFDFAKYGMKIYTDGEDVWLPLSVLTNMMTDIATNHLRFDGKNLYLTQMTLKDNPDDPILLNDTFTALLNGQERPADLIAQCYADLCFDLDYFFGHPGVAMLDEMLEEKGLDQTLTDLGEKGAAIKEGLLSADMMEYLAALQKLFTIWLADGHTSALDITNLVQSKSIKLEKLARLSAEYFTDMKESKQTLAQLLRMAITPQRKFAWGDSFYREYGNTAIIRLDSFMPDEDAWAAWYRGEGSFPDDCIGKVVSGLKRARENGQIRNVLIDLTCNSGGSSDVLMLLAGLTTGRNYLRGRTRLTGQTMVATFEADTNFDGIFDEKDREAGFDFNYGILTSRQAFSCGNLFPVVMQESGAVVIGEKTGGGSCCIQFGTDSLGLRWLMSSAQWQLIDADGNSVESGCTVDIPITAQSIGILDSLIGDLGVDEGLPIFTDLFDDEYLNTLMNVWFHETVELAPAA